MAYLDLRLAGALADAAHAQASDVAPNALTPPERDAVLFSLREGRTARRLGRIAPRLGRLWLDISETRIFAGERTEAIRRYAARYAVEGGGMAAGEDERLAEAGISALEAAEIRLLVERDAHPARPKRHLRRSLGRIAGRLLLASVPASLAAMLYFWLAAEVEDRLSALVLAIVFTTGIVSPVALAAHPTGRRA